MTFPDLSDTLYCVGIGVTQVGLQRGVHASQLTHVLDGSCVIQHAHDARLYHVTRLAHSFQNLAGSPVGHVRVLLHQQSLSLKREAVCLVNKKTRLFILTLNPKATFTLSIDVAMESTHLSLFW